MDWARVACMVCMVRTSALLATSGMECGEYVSWAVYLLRDVNGGVSTQQWTSGALPWTLCCCPLRDSGATGA